MLNETFGQRLRRWRQEKGLRSKDLAKKLGITLPYLSQLEADLAVPSEELAKTIAKVLGQSEEETVFLARRVPRQIDDILQRFPNIAPPYFRKARTK